MSTKNVIVFDVDDTIIKGNLTLCFLKVLAKERIYFLYKCIPVLLHGIILLSLTLPNLVKRILLSGKNFDDVNKLIETRVKKFLTKVFNLFNSLNLSDKNLEKKAKTIFTKKFFEKNVYAEAVKKIEEHIKDQKIVILLSGSPQALVNVLYDHLRKILEKKNIRWKNKFIAIGSHIDNKEVHACVSEAKVKALHELFKDDDYTLQLTYSDNSFMSDLPLMLKSVNGGVVIAKKSSLYQALTKKIQRKLAFLPAWGK
jgi:phosphoserine phosphatase